MSRTSPRLVVCLAFCLGALVVLSCREVNPVFCDGHPGDRICSITGGSASLSCTSNTQCTLQTPICDTGGMVCVQCTPTQPAACGGDTPVCGSDNACRGCTADAECASQTCLPDGACADVGSVLYAAADGSSASNCRAAKPCSLLRAIDLIDATWSTIRLAAGTYVLATTLALPFDAHLVGRGAVLERDGGGTGATLAVAAGTDIALDYLDVRGGDGDPAGAGITCDQATLTAREVTLEGNAAAGLAGTGCTVTLAHARIASNRGFGVAIQGGSLAMTRSVVVGNQGGAIAIVRGEYELTNNVIVKNGNPATGSGGVAIGPIDTAGRHVFEFNTVAYNQSEPGIAPGVVCIAVRTPLVFSSSIVFGNATSAAPDQVEGAGCSWSYSDIGPLAVPGTGNLAVDPMFADLAQDDFHLQATSPLRDAADPMATVMDDIDGDSRPHDTGPDMGADEIK
jgi:hypothetical protein